MNIANEMQIGSNSILANEFCCFDGKVHRTKAFTTLTATLYHPLLQRQIPLAVMEGNSEDSENIERFCRIFNQAFKEASYCEQKFMPRGWTTDMATANFSGLEHKYREDVRNKIKGCEFHFRTSLSKHSSMLGEDSAMSTGLANELLLASTKEAYEAAYDNLKSFINFGGERNKLKE